MVLPLLLTPATHSKTDVPGSVQAGPAGPPRARRSATAARWARTRCWCAPSPPGWPRPGWTGRTPDAAVVLVAAGAADPDANAEVARTARLLWEGRGWGAVEVAYASATRPTVDEAVARARRLGHARVVVAPYFLAPGYFSRKAARLAGDATVAPVLGAHPLVVDLVLERLDEAAAGPVAMNCDHCMFRTPFPGREARVGEPQAPHEHPDDAGLRPDHPDDAR